MKIDGNLHFFPWNNPSANNCNTYFIDGKKKILVDPGHYHLFGHVRDQLSQLSLTPEDMDMVIITHGHPDHMEGIRVFENMETLIALHGTEMTFIRSVAPHYGEALGVSDFEPDILLTEGELVVGDLAFQVIHTPGHSPRVQSVSTCPTEKCFSPGMWFLIRESAERISPVETERRLRRVSKKYPVWMCPFC